MSSPQGMGKSKAWNRWTDSETRYLRAHREDGAELIAAALGRSIESVRSKAREMGISLVFRTLPVCPVCGTRQVRPNTRAGSHGMCPACWEMRKADSMRERSAELAATRVYDAQKKRAKRRRGNA